MDSAKNPPSTNSVSAAETAALTFLRLFHQALRGGTGANGVYSGETDALSYSDSSRRFSSSPYETGETVDIGDSTSMEPARARATPRSSEACRRARGF